VKAAQINKPGDKFHIVEREVPKLGDGEVRVRVQACGVCHSDSFTREGTFPGITYPRVPGHEVIGLVDALGAGVQGWQKGDRVGVGWHGGHCFTCDPCRRGDFMLCENGEICGVTYDGGYQEYMVARAEALARVPEALDSAEAAPLLCAGITTYNALRHSQARPGDLVAIQGIGGLGHLAVQYANRMGFRTVAISGGADKAGLAKKLGAVEYIDASAEDPGQALKAMGGARLVLATAPNAQAIESVLGGLGAEGQLLLVAACRDPIKVPPLLLIGGRRSIAGWPSGHAADAEDTLNFSALTGSLPQVETFPLERVEEAYERMMSNKARFRVVLTLE